MEILQAMWTILKRGFLIIVALALLALGQGAGQAGINEISNLFRSEQPQQARPSLSTADDFNREAVEMAAEHGADIQCLPDLLNYHMVPTSALIEATLQQKGPVLVLGDLIDFRDDLDRDGYEILVRVTPRLHSEESARYYLNIRGACEKELAFSFIRSVGVDLKDIRVGLVLSSRRVTSTWGPGGTGETKVVSTLHGNVLAVLGERL